MVTQTEPTGNTEDQTAPEPAPESPRRLVAYLLAGIVVVYLSTWSGSVFFYFEFQRPLFARDTSSRSSVLWKKPEEVKAVAPAGWSVNEADNLSFVLPPGDLVELKKDNGIVARFTEGEVQIQSFPPGFLVSLLNNELQVVGEKPELDPSDAAVLEEIVRKTPEDFRFSWSRPQRSHYAARLLCKMLLWENDRASRVEMASREEPREVAVLVENELGKVKVVAAHAGGVLVVVVPEDAPPEWKVSPAAWLPPSGSDK